MWWRGDAGLEPRPAQRSGPTGATVPFQTSTVIAKHDRRDGGRYLDEFQIKRDVSISPYEAFSELAESVNLRAPFQRIEITTESYPVSEQQYLTLGQTALHISPL